MLCLPLVSLKRSSHGASDWTSVVMGFSSGDVRVYTADSGALVFSQIFHDQPVVELKCATFDRWAHLSHGGAGEQRDELTVLHRDNVLVVLDGFSLFQTMRACRNQLAIGWFPFCLHFHTAQIRSVSNTFNPFKSLYNLA